MNTASANTTATARDFIASQLRAAYPRLVPVSEQRNALVAAAKNIRIELAARFPRTKFSVRSSRFAGGDSIHVSWCDGPTDEQVDAIVGRYRAGSFDSMADSYEYRADRAWSDTFGDAKYVHTQRDYSDALVARVLARMWRYWGDLDNGVAPTLADFRTGRLWGVKARCSDFGREVHRALARHTCHI
jgi:hypothetical protein